MKSILTLTITLFSISLIAQVSDGVTKVASTSSEILRITNGNNFGSSVTFINPKRITEGSVHLFKNWKNHAVIITNDGQKFSLKNINLNIKRNVFESKIDDGSSIFTFNFNNIDRFIVNNKVFKNFYYDDDNRVYELIYESDEFSIMKGHTIQLIEGSANPMVNRKFDKYVQKSSYFIMKDDKIKPFKLKKKRILKLVDGDIERAQKIEQYVKSNRLSYKKEYDVRKVLEFTAKN